MYRSISRKSIVIFRIRYTLMFSLITFLLGFLGVINFYFYMFFLLLYFIVFLFLFFFYAPKKYKNILFFISPDHLILCYGVFFLKKITFSIDKLQYVEVRKGVDERIFHLSTLIFYTAGGKIKIQGLDDKTALGIKKCLYRRLK